MAAKNNKTTELTDIPLTLAQGDSVEMTAAKAEKNKSNSLKRFFRTARSSMSSSKSTDQADVSGNSEMKASRSLQLRFGSFKKNDGIQPPNYDIEAGSSAERSKLKSPPSTESRLSLQGRLSNYWSTVFKKSVKKSPITDVLPQDVVDSPADVNKIDQNDSDNL